MNSKTKAYVALVACVAGIIAMFSVLRLDFPDPFRFGGFLLIATLASTFKVRIPGLEGIYSLNFVVILAALSEMGLIQLLILAAACAVTQSYWRAARTPKLEQMAFNTSNLVISVAGAYAIFHLTSIWPEEWRFLSVALAAIGYYVLNTGMTAIVLSLVQGGGLKQVWDQWTIYTLPYYLLGSTLASTWTFCNRYSRFQGALLSVLLLCCIYNLFRKSVPART